MSDEKEKKDEKAEATAEAKPEEKKAEAPAAAPAEAKPEEKKADAPTTATTEAKPEEKKADAPPKAEEKKDDAKKTEGEHFYPNKWGRVILTSAEEIMGEKGVRSMLNLGELTQYIDNYPPDDMKKKFPFAHVSATQKTMWEMYGKRGARVFMTRAGEQSFKDGLAQFKSVAAAAEVAMKVGNLEAKIKIGLEFFSKFFNSVSDQKVSIGEDDKHFIWYIERCPMCWGRKADEPQCYLAVGVLQGALAWVSEGKRWRVSPTECIASGAEKGVIKIEKIPVE